LILYCLIAGVISLILGNSLPAGNSYTSHIWQRPLVAVEPPFTAACALDKVRDELAKVSDLKNLRTGIYAVRPDTGEYIDLNGKQSFAAASMIKTPVLVSLLVAIDRGELKQDQQLTIRQDLIAGGSGFLQWRPCGTKLSLKETAELMIIFSDNTATNMIIDALGGMERCNKDFAAFGLTQTRLNNWLADFDGTNKTSPYDLVYLLGRVDRGDLISPAMREWMYRIFLKTRVRTLLPPGLPPGTLIAHKTGDIGSMVGDAGIVEAKDGTRYIVSVQVERPHNDRRANMLIRDLSKLIYEAFDTRAGAEPKMTQQVAYKPPALSLYSFKAAPAQSFAVPAHRRQTRSHHKAYKKPRSTRHRKSH